MKPVFEITKAAYFDAAHYIEQGPSDHRYRRLHGHSFKVEVSVRGEMLDAGWVADLDTLDVALKAVAVELDHGLLNDKPGLEVPTLERLCLYFAERLRSQFPGLSRVALSRPTIGETCVLSL
ncbi:6-pyruvoyl tetrahydropterin synthase family protein [Caulobacter vibrioides]|uniref:6-carboxy-5,6,7,8-tetrahydropterin synthase n=2 Tax=Caulobacter vibrioides TaxID=155892 RepID=Q9A3P4_CAUVC|nr:6-carboxytetrahydropterin synthase [Caulobacter vibrioides]YP_002518633.1 queuosine biosynthesis protein QueD [Caulobacter vibrioides NA1000]AAK25120.1 6-pyruvoyl tetrahydrobiopterin synthase, putative [Caulobacter vibrioides CB15]ACL96725.1 queuosine biosynthesis protein QueD [Caulobacter vibrioides NA1000]ATC26043.1 6-pyruvoyl tetrahydrobiopterin synthase [Caulobacter vibrioides]ATC29985.1 6-pyruvoyl tetrahydrobiopterin synthase [Caulobacter vibrioides]AZH14184.1 6-pyruvoyl tetrahydropte